MLKRLVYKLAVFQNREKHQDKKYLLITNNDVRVIHLSLQMLVKDNKLLKIEQR